MSTSRRTFLLGTAAAAVAPVLPPSEQGAWIDVTLETPYLVPAAPFNLTATEVRERIAVYSNAKWVNHNGQVWGIIGTADLPAGKLIRIDIDGTD